jgi:glycosyltransferase involved in cell wall biosynthesis
MKIAFIHFWTLRMRRGVETMTVSLANELAKCGVEVSILTARQTQEPLVKSSNHVRVKQFPTFRFFEFTTIVPFYALNLAHEQYDVVVVFFADFGEGRALQLAARFTRPRLFLYLTFPYESAPHRYHAYERWGFGQRAEKILADAEFTARRGEEFFRRPVQVLPSGTDPDRFRPDAEKRAMTRLQLGLRDDDFVLLNVSALEERKGTWRVIEALPAMLAQCPNVRYLILGKGSEETHLRQRVAALGLESRVIFAGTTTDLAPYYSAADIFVMLPDAEAGSLACLEAMSSGLPIVVSRTGGFTEVMDESIGRIVDMNDSAATVHAVLELASDGALRKRLGVAGRATVIENFSWGRLAEQLLKIMN